MAEQFKRFTDAFIAAQQTAANATKKAEVRHLWDAVLRSFQPHFFFMGSITLPRCVVLYNDGTIV